MANTKATPLRAVPSGIGKWLELPATVTAPSPEDRSKQCTFRLATADTLTMARVGRRQPNFELWSVVLGSPPPVPGVEHRNRKISGDLICLDDAHALFRGIERPLANDDEGSNVLAYIQKPAWLYEYDPDMVSVALKVPVPQDLVFVTYARIDEAIDGPEAARGTVTHWGFVEADSSESGLPVDFSSRYKTRLW